MGRRPKIIVDEASGAASMRIRVARPIRLLCEELSAQYGMPIDKALDMLLASMATAITDPQRGEHAARLLLGPMFADTLKGIRARNFGAIRNGPTIDVDVLHRSSKTKSGFEGVYVSGQGFRAVSRAVGSMSGKHLGVFSTAEEAAWARYLYYTQMNLPYGQWEEDLIRYRTEIDPSARALSDADALKALAAHNEVMGLGHLNRLPGRPQNPSTVRPDVATEPQMAGFEPGDDIGTTIAEMRAKNDARERALRDDVKRRQREAALASGEVDDDADDDSEAGDAG